MPVDFQEESTATDFQPEAIDFREDTPVDFQPEPIPEPRLDLSLMEPAKSPEELAARNLEGIKRIREQFPNYGGPKEGEPGLRMLWQAVTTPIAHAITPSELANGIDALKAFIGVDPESPEYSELVQEALSEKDRKPTTAEEIAAGVQNVAANVTTTPLALALPGAPSGVQRLLGYGFTAQQLAHLPTAIKEAKEAKTPYERTKAYLGLGLDVGFPLLFAAHEAVTFAKPKPVAEVAAEVGPATAAAIKETGIEGEQLMNFQRPNIESDFSNAGSSLAEEASKGKGVGYKLSAAFKAVIDAIPTRWFLNIDTPRKPISDFGTKYLYDFLSGAAEKNPDFQEAADFAAKLKIPATWLGGEGELSTTTSGASAGMMASFPVIRVNPSGVPSRVLVHEAAHLAYEMMPAGFRKLWESKFDTDSLAEIYRRQNGSDPNVLLKLEQLDKDYAAHGLKAAPVEMFAISMEAADALQRNGKLSEPSISYYIKPDQTLIAEVGDLFRKPQPTEVSNASEIGKTTEVLPNVPASAIEGEIKVPTTTGAERVSGSEQAQGLASSASGEVSKETLTPEGKTSIESPGPGAASPADFEEGRALDFSEKQFMPDFLERDKERAVFSQPFGIGRWLSKIPILGRLLDPNVKSNSYEQQGLAAYFAARNGVGPSQASYIGSRFGAEIRNAFEANESGDLNVGRTSESQSLKISDVFEELQRDPNAYDLTPEQRRVWTEVLEPILREKGELVKKYDLAKTEDANGDPIGHFHRIVTKFPEGKEPTITRTGQAVGSKIPSQRGRVFRKSEQEGWEKGYQYELDPVKRLVSDIERTYKAIADKRLIDDPVFEGKTKTEFESQLREVFSDELGSGEMSEQSFQNILDNKLAQGRVFQPGYSGKFFEPETAKMLNDALQSGDSRLRKIIATGNDFAKALVLGFDLGVGQIQLLPTLFRNPSIWAKANWESLKAIFNPDSFGQFLSKHEEAARELAQTGSSVGQLQEYMSGLKPGQAITHIPVLGTVAKAFGRQFQTALDVAKIQLWEAWRSVTPPDQRLSVVRSIESQLNIGRMESIGVGGRQALTERALLLAPSYYRGAVNFVAALTESGVSGKIARQGLTAFVGGGLALYYAVGKMLGMEDEELKKRLNPARPDFLQWVGEGANGRKITFGIGGIHRSLLRLAGNMVKTSIENPGNWATLSTEKNPITRWLRGHGALLPTAALTALSGRDFMGQEADVGTVIGNLIPLTAQQFIRKQGEPPVTATELATSFLGLNAFPESTRSQFIRERDSAAQKQYGKSFEELPLRDQLRITRELNSSEPFNAKVPANAKQIQQAFENSVKRVQRITKALPDETQKALQDAGVHITGYEPTITLGKDRLFLTENQQQRYEALIVEEYSKRLAQVKFDQLQRMDSEQRQKWINKVIAPAKDRAKARLLSELRKK